MSDPANEAVSVMMSFGSSTIPIAKDLAELFIDALHTTLSKLGNISGEGVKTVASKAIDQVDGLGHEGKVSLKNLVHENKQLIAIPVERDDLKVLESQLKKYSVTFAVMEDPLTNGISIHVKAEDYDRIEQALTGVIKDLAKETEQAQEATEGALDSNAVGGEKAPKASPEATQEVPIEPMPGNENTPATNPNTQTSTIDTRPATEAQEQFIESLYEKGVISDSEIELYRENPTVASANDLLNVHRDNAGFVDLGNQNAVQAEAASWSEQVTVWFEVENDEAETVTHSAQLSEKQVDGQYKLEALDNGQAKVVDYRGQEVWSGVTVAGNIDASMRLAERGLETHKNKESLRLRKDEGLETPAKEFDKKLDKAEDIAAKIAQEATSIGRDTPNRLRENVR